MTIITKKAENGITVKVDSEGKKYRGKFIVLIKDGKEIASGQDFFIGEKWLELPEGAVSAIRNGDTYTALGQITTDAVEACIAEYYDAPEIRLPRERDELVDAIGAALDNWTYQRERDFDEDIGFHASPKAKEAVKAAELALKEFDAANPELAAKIKAEMEAETSRQIQSALNS